MDMKKIMFILSFLMLAFSSVAEEDKQRPGPIKVIDPHFVTQVYDWENDDMYVAGSIFGVRLESENATDFEAILTFKSPIPFLSLQEYEDVGGYQGVRPFENFGDYRIRWYYIDLTPDGDDNYFEIPVNWGDVLVFYSYIEMEGVSDDSEPVLTTDYITDPAILARINELKNIYTGIEDVLPEVDPAADLIHRFGDTLKVRPDVSHVTIYNDKGEKVLYVTDPGDEVSIQEIGSGVYFAVAKTADGLSKILKFIK